MQSTREYGTIRTTPGEVIPSMGPAGREYDPLAKTYPQTELDE